MKSNFTYLLFFSLYITTFISCVEEQDFGQYDDLRITPTLEASMLYIEAPESLINTAGNDSFISRNFDFDAFNSDIFAERVLDGSVTYIVENTTSKLLDFTIDFLDMDGNVLYTENIPPVPAGMEDYSLVIAFGPSGKSIDIIKNTSRLKVTAVNANGDRTSTSNLPDPKIILKSSGRFRVDIK